MASYIPPPNNNTIFNPSDFSSVNDSSLTLDTAEKLFIQKAGDTVTGNITFTQPLTCNSSISCAGVTDTSSLSCQALTCTSIIDTGALSCSGITDTGTLSCTTLSCSGITDTGPLSCTTLSCSGITDTGTLSCTILSCTGENDSGNLSVSGNTTLNTLVLGSGTPSAPLTNQAGGGFGWNYQGGLGELDFYSYPQSGAGGFNFYIYQTVPTVGTPNLLLSLTNSVLSTSKNISTTGSTSTNGLTNTGSETTTGLISANGGLVIGGGTLQVNSGSGLVGITHYRTGGFNASNIVNRLVYYQTSITNSGTAVSIPVTTISGNSNNANNYGFYTVVAYTTTTNNSSWGQNVYFPTSPFWSTGGGGIGFGTVPAINFSGSSISVTGINGTTVNVWIRVELFQ